MIEGGENAIKYLKLAIQELQDYKKYKETITDIEYDIKSIKSIIDPLIEKEYNDELQERNATYMDDVRV